MGCAILSGEYNGTRKGAVLVCTTSGVAFGPLFESAEEAEKFLEVLGVDPRSLPLADLERQYAQFIEAYVCTCGELREAPLGKKPPHKIGERFECDSCRQTRVTLQEMKRGTTRRTA